MTTEQTSATATIAPEEPDSTPPAPSDAAATPVNGPELKAAIPTPTDEEVQQHGLYYYWLPERERVLYRAALATDGLRQEIAAVRTAIGYVLLTNPANTAMILKAISLLERLIRTNYTLFDKEEQSETAQATTKQGPQNSPSDPEVRIPRSVRRQMAREEAKRHFSR